MKKLLIQIEQAQSFTAVKKILKEHFPSTKKMKGSARIVIPLDDKHVLKVAYNEKGISQNLNEQRVYFDIPNYYKRFLAKVKKADRVAGTWLIQEKVKVKGRCYDRKDLFMKEQPKLFRLMNTFDVNDGDLDQVGYSLNRGTYILYDYGLTTSEYFRLYSK